MASESDYLTPEKLAEIERKLGDRTQSHDFRQATEALLRHLRALSAPADGEALGRELFMLCHEGAGETVWRYYEAESKAPWIAAALHLHAIGHAAGALSREGEIAALRASVERLTAERDRASLEGARDERARCIAAIKRRAHEEWMIGAPDLARRRADLVEIGVDVLEAMPEIIVPDADDDSAQSPPLAAAERDRLTAELAAARDVTARWAAKEGIARAERDIAQTESARLKRREQDIIEACERVADGGQYRADIIGAINQIRGERDRFTVELAEVRKEATAVREDVVHSMMREADARVVSARADGAREERRLTIDDMLTVARETHPLAQPAVHDAMSALGKRIKARPAGAADPSARGDR